MNIFCLIALFLCLTGVMPTHADGECHNGRRCLVYDECEALYSRWGHNHFWRLKFLARVHCGVNDNQEPMVCCPSGLTYE
ncbi:CLIP domain-containing serine protease HP8-like [Bicyclus anynana]|uniref:CLIP domain-containing serine protease HP8-like n=1 Tax=Bicyclus anynana TaxID=110368 RepID=A0ABM3LYI5_BICAN|nr:CLIP domain-containing serine protease HP8-like [Bicyclus anynana]